VSDYSFTVEPGKVTLLTGHNGAGKTSCVNSLGGLVPLAAGTITVTVDGREEEWRRVGPGQLSSRGISLVPSGNAVFSNLSVQENLRAAALGTTAGDAAKSTSWVLEEMFPALGGMRRRSAGALSGGERQQLAIALSLVQQPRVLILDEPSSGVSPAVAQVIANALHQLATDGRSVLVVEQSLSTFLPVADHVLVLNRGRGHYDGPAQGVTPEMLWSMF
jgi:branched-chain amino acid transport system ATP-binding protein